MIGSELLRIVDAIHRCIEGSDGRTRWAALLPRSFGTRPFGSREPVIVGDGWDTVLVAALPDGALGGAAPSRPGRPPVGGTGGAVLDPRSLLERIGTPVSGPWGSGHLVSTAVLSVVVTDDGRVAAGAVPQQVLLEALSR